MEADAFCPAIVALVVIASFALIAFDGLSGLFQPEIALAPAPFCAGLSVVDAGVVAPVVCPYSTSSRPFESGVAHSSTLPAAMSHWLSPPHTNCTPVFGAASVSDLHPPGAGMVGR